MKRHRKITGYVIDAAIIVAVVAAIAANVLSMPPGPSPQEQRRIADSTATARDDSIARRRADRAAARRHRRDSIDSVRAARRQQRILPSPLTRPVPGSRSRESH